jgi:hypothetical protein
MNAGNIIQLMGIIVALIALGWTAYGVHLNRKTKQAEFWLRLRDDFTRYDEVHLKLRPGGDWSRANTGPQSVDEWIKVEGYMGLFEHCESMLSQGLLNEKVFIESFKYRVANLYANPTIKQEKLVKRASGWTRFIELGDRLGLPNPQHGT